MYVNAHLAPLSCRFSKNSAEVDPVRAVQAGVTKKRPLRRLSLRITCRSSAKRVLRTPNTLLTDHEKEVPQLLAGGKSDKAASQLTLSLYTIQTHRAISFRSSNCTMQSKFSSMRFAKRSFKDHFLIPHVK